MQFKKAYSLDTRMYTKYTTVYIPYRIEHKIQKEVVSEYAEFRRNVGM